MSSTKSAEHLKNVHTHIQNYSILKIREKMFGKK